MSRKLPLLVGAVAMTLIALTSSGCVDRRFVIESDPPGAVVYVNDKRVGATPLDVPFPYYGKYRFEFVRDGYESVTVEENVCAPWYEYFPIEFVVENLWPWTVHDIHYIPSKPMALPPMQAIPAEVIYGRAQQLQSRGQALVPQGAVVPVGPPGPVSPDLQPIPSPTPPPSNQPLTPVPIKQ
jgi:hypothetical protein